MQTLFSTLNKDIHTLGIRTPFSHPRQSQFYDRSIEMTFMTDGPTDQLATRQYDNQMSVFMVKISIATTRSGMTWQYATHANIMATSVNVRAFAGEPFMIEVVAIAAASLGVALCRYLTARTFVKHANKKNIPAIARAMYPRRQLDRGRRQRHAGRHVRRHQTVELVNHLRDLTGPGEAGQPDQGQVDR
jgi:hypothetical protein